jgi:hypothetical protein
MHWLRRLWWRIEIILRKSRVEEELDQELRYHLKREIQENIRNGMDPIEARRRARVDFGGLDRTMERVRDERGGRGIEDLAQDIRYSLRRMSKNPGFSLSVSLILALGIGATVALFSVLDAALFSSLPFPESDRLVMGRTTFSGRVSPHGSYRQSTWILP